MNDLVTGLQPATAYKARFVATQLGRENDWRRLLLRDLQSSSMASTETPTGVTGNQATLRGAVNPNGFATTFTSSSTARPPPTGPLSMCRR